MNEFLKLTPSFLISSDLSVYLSKINMLFQKNGLSCIPDEFEKYLEWIYLLNSIETYKNILSLCNEQELISYLKSKLLTINEQDFIVPVSYAVSEKENEKNYYELCICVWYDVNLNNI